jgi:hypothetical protein
MQLEKMYMKLTLQFLGRSWLLVNDISFQYRSDYYSPSVLTFFGENVKFAVNYFITPSQQI